MHWFGKGKCLHSVPACMLAGEAQVSFRFSCHKVEVLNMLSFCTKTTISFTHNFASVHAIATPQWVSKCFVYRKYETACWEWQVC